MTNLTLAVDEHLLSRSRAAAEAMGTTVNQLVRDYLSSLVDPNTPADLADEFVRLSTVSPGNSRGWKFNRDEVHERR